MKISIRVEREIKMPLGDEKLKKFVTYWPLLEDWLKEILEIEIKW